MEVLYEQFIRERQYLLNVSEKTVEAYRWAWKAFEPALKGKPSVAKADLLQRIAELRTAAPALVRALTAVIRSTRVKTSSRAGAAERGSSA